MHIRKRVPSFVSCEDEMLRREDLLLQAGFLVALVFSAAE